MKLKEKFKNLFVETLDMYRYYPVTLVLIILLSAVVIILEQNFDGDTTVLEYVGMFLATMAVHSVFIEQVVTFKRKLLYFISYVVSAAFCLFFIYLFGVENELIFGMEGDLVRDSFSKLYIILYVTLAVFTIFSMYKKSELDFEEFCFRTVFDLIRCFIVFGVLNIGLVIILLIFSELIVEIDILEELEIALFGVVLPPLFLKALINKKSPVGKFGNILTLYVLEPLLCIAFIIIYVYIFKIIILWELPKNQVFRILGFLFSIGMPIWTMVMGMKREDNFLGKISKFLPLVFIPFIILQTICMMLRICDYGFTTERYMGLMLVVFETAYVVLYLLQFLLKKSFVQYTFFAVNIIVIIMLAVPFINMFDTVYNSQYKRLVDALEAGLYEQAGESYDEIKWSSARNKNRIEKLVTDEQLEQMEEKPSYMVSKDIYDSVDLFKLKLEDYKYITKVSTSIYSSSDEIDTDYIELRLSEGETEYISISAYLDSIFRYEKEKDENKDNSGGYDKDFRLDHGFHYITLDSTRTIYVTYINFRYEYNTKEDTYTVNSINLDGYLLEK